MPVSRLVLILDAVSFARHALAARRIGGSAMSGFVSGERFRYHVSDLIGPTAVVPDDFVSNLAHGVLRFRVTMLPRGGGCHQHLCTACQWPSPSAQRAGLFLGLIPQ